MAFCYICFMLRLAVKTGLIAGSCIVLFSCLKSEWYYTRYAPDLFITCLALFFALLGFIFRKNIVPSEIAATSHLEQRMTLLSKRETEVLELLLTELRNKEIADRLHIELSTLKSHINTIYKKLEVTNRRELCRQCNHPVVFN